LTAIVLVTHDGLGDCLVRQAETIIGHPAMVYTISVRYDANPTQARDSIGIAIQIADQGDGVIVLTDLPGATPHNLAVEASSGKHSRVVSGVNLSMLLKVINYSGNDLETLMAKALAGGHDGIVNA